MLKCLYLCTYSMVPNCFEWEYRQCDYRRPTLLRASFHAAIQSNPSSVHGFRFLVPTTPLVIIYSTVQQKPKI
ncbi:hypothetical protein M758_11G058100 [Ceratodon purpureus]|nr:hypothetical protein M758_11G058100 [Ceratodon purpureus]